MTFTVWRDEKGHGEVWIKNPRSNVWTAMGPMPKDFLDKYINHLIDNKAKRVNWDKNVPMFRRKKL